MPSIHQRRGWEIPESRLTSETAYLNRRTFMGMMGLGAISAAGGSAFAQDAKPAEPVKLYPAKRNENFKLDRDITEEGIAGGYNNFYEFTTEKTLVALRARNFKPKPWTIEVGGLVKKELKFDLDELLKKVTLEERHYRFRCVEAWSMAVPWTGFPLKQFIDLCEPKADAKYVRFITVNRPDEMPGIKFQNWYPWPYYEALRMDEAVNDLTMFVTGIFGKELPNQNGAPIRLIVPWKYGYKSAKSIARIEFVEKKPDTFWSKLQPEEYPFESNIDPKVPHPRWTQARERFLKKVNLDNQIEFEMLDTLPYNGYGEFVAKLYG